MPLLCARIRKWSLPGSNCTMSLIKAAHPSSPKDLRTLSEHFLNIVHNALKVFARKLTTFVDGFNVAGVRGAITDTWSYDASAQYSKVKADQLLKLKELKQKHNNFRNKMY